MFDTALLRTEGSVGTLVSSMKSGKGERPPISTAIASIYGLAYVNISAHKVAAGHFDRKLIHLSGCGHNGGAEILVRAAFD